MSHESKINMVIKDKGSLIKACERLGLEFHEGQKTYRSYSQGRCDHAISMPNGRGYEIGVREEENGEMSLHWDSYGGAQGMSEMVGGSECGKLKQFYGLEAAKVAARKKGVNAYEKVKEDGSIDLTIEVQE